MTQNETNVVPVTNTLNPEVVKEIGQSPNELTPPELLALIVKKLNILILIEIMGNGLTASDFDLSDDPNSTTT